jgi:hypothetical protein
VNIGVTCSIKPPNAEEYQDIPFYVSQYKVPLRGTISLTPLDKVSVWIQREGHTHYMVTDMMNDNSAVTLAVDFTSHKVQTVSYGVDGIWRHGPLTPLSTSNLDGMWARRWDELYEHGLDGN